MLNHSFTAVVERNAVMTESFITEPYEAGWAKEARWFIRVLSMSPGTVLHVLPQLSPDGLFWCGAESPGLTIAGCGTFTLATPDNFGQWLALKGELAAASAAESAADAAPDPSGGQAFVKLIIYLTLKE